MSKYIIMNCPALLPRTKLCDSGNMETPPNFCENITDCLLKQIVGECICETIIDVECRGDLAERILSELEIEECE